MDRPGNRKWSTLIVAGVASWLGFALVCYGPLHETVGRVYMDVAREIVQLHFLQQWFNLSDPQTEYAICDSE